MKAERKKRIIVTDIQGNTSRQEIVPVDDSLDKRIVVLNPSTTQIAANILDIVLNETARLRKLSENPMGLNPGHTEQVKSYAKIIVDFSKEERESRNMNDLSNLTDEDISLLAGEAKKYLADNKKK